MVVNSKEMRGIASGCVRKILRDSISLAGPRKNFLSGSQVKLNVSQALGDPPRAHPSTGSQSCSATPGLIQVPSTRSRRGLGPYSIAASEVNLSQLSTGCSLSLLPCTKESMVERRKPNKYSKATRRREVPTGGLAALARPDWSRARTPLAHAPRPTTPSRHQPPADILAALCGTGSRPSTGQSPERAR